MSGVTIPQALITALVDTQYATLVIEQVLDKWIAMVDDVGDVIAYGTGPTPGHALRDAARDLETRNEDGAA